MASRWVEINNNLRLCRKVFAILKQKNPRQLPDKINIIAYRENSRKCSVAQEDKRLGMKDDNKNWVAHFDHPFLTTPHICIKQDFLFFPFDIPTRKKKDQGKAAPRWKYCNGNWILIEATVHEISHYVQIGHGKNFFKIYYKFLAQMAESVISGEFYYWYSRQHQSKKHSGKADKQTSETKEWVDDYLSWTQHLPGLFGK